MDAHAEPLRANTPRLSPADRRVHVAGAGPSGLAAAITLAQSGCEVVVHEARAEVGARFVRDLQGIENWSVPDDAWTELGALGLADLVKARPFHTGTAFDYRDHAYTVSSARPIFYLVERGPHGDSLDTALLRRALSLGVEVRFNEPVRTLSGHGVLATGPHAADGIAAGYQFQTNAEEGFWTICDDRIAPKGYAYLLVMDGRGVMKTCLFDDFHNVRDYVERTEQRFQRLVGIGMRQRNFHAGVGNFRLPMSALAGGRPTTGEHAGFQDGLWGFGIRYALASGVLAARSLLDGSDYDVLWRRDLATRLRVSHANRWLYSVIGNRGYRWFLRRYAAQDARRFLGCHYGPSALKWVLYQWARRRVLPKRADVACVQPGCDCVWCRCLRELDSLPAPESAAA